MRDASTRGAETTGAIGAPYPDYDAPGIETVADLVRLAGSRYADAAAFEWADGASVSYAGLFAAADAVATALGAICPEPARNSDARGLRPLVRIPSRDPFLFAASFFGTLLAGLVAVPCPGEDDPRRLVGDRGFAATLGDDLLSSLGVSIPSASAAGRRRALSPRPSSGGRRAGLDADVARRAGIGAAGGHLPAVDQVRVVLGSSGTTGARKAVMLTERGIFADLVAGLRRYSFPEGGRHMAVIPCSHAFGIVCDLLGPLATGGTVCVPPDPRAALLQLARFCPTQLNVPPRFASVLADLLDAGRDPRGLTGGRLKKMLCGGAGLDPAVSRRLRAHGIEALGCYGLTECSPCVSVNRDGWRKDGSAGLPLGCNEVLVDVGGALLGAGAGEATPVGEICVRGPNVMAGYLDDPALTGSVLHDGLLRTGDLGRIDADGFLWVAGRADDLLVLPDGTKVAPEVPERAIREIPGVVEALVYLAEDARGARVLGARVHVREGYDARDVERAVRRADLPDGLVLGEVLTTRDELPKTTTGKLRRR